MRSWILLVLVVSGCAGSAPAAVDEAQDAVPAGQLRGIVVDQAIVPVADAIVTLDVAGAQRETVTDAEGGFLFEDVPPGTWQVRASHPQYESAQVTTVTDGQGTTVRLQIARLFFQEAFTVPWVFQGYINCGYSAGLSAPCVIDYTMIVVPGGAAPFLNGITGDVRRFVLPVEEGWQTMVTEITWEPSLSATTPALSVTASFFGRTSAHSYTGESGPSPLRMQIDVNLNETHPEWIPPEGKDDFLLFVNPSTAGSGMPVAVTVEQRFELFHHVFYYGVPPEGWSIVAGDEPPF